ncbi:MAG: hypothetical protein AABY93_08045 [Bacteroidota bacterium]
MKIKFSQLFASVAILVVSHLSFPSFAQEEESLPYELQDANNQELNINNEDKALIYEHEVMPEKISSSESNQNAVQVSSKSKNSESGKSSSTPPRASTKEGEDALSFNFLYYIIQKYKFSDIVDQ